MSTDGTTGHALHRPHAALAMSAAAATELITSEFRAALAGLVRLAPGAALDEFGSERAVRALRDAELLITGWGCPPLDARVLSAAPHLRAVVHTAGSVKGLATDELFGRGIEVSSAAAANALPVAEYSLGVLLLDGKDFLGTARAFRSTRRDGRTPRCEGNYRRVVGVVSASLVGRRLMELLRPHDIDVLLHDPYVGPAEAAAMGASPVGLDELFARSDAITLHTPLLPETRGLVTAELIGAMRPGALLLNTARGAVVDTPALTQALLAGRIRAVLDVTDPEPLPPDHPLWDCEHVVLTPHIAGSVGGELRRLTDAALSEISRWTAGDGFAHPVLKHHLAFSA